ncbi:hypothetical protein [Hymenobacter negativus]|uniref:Uncharacterized protein n=1 Tax=Hymenobacter negativus TaxID=2795026 RepID=A0ABS3Q8Z9_9BACT|nr:hypothetical protein [Hymenobacter negativus]MBO2007725.1 hypothetical protein [Hymenobacter negativus]
MKQKYLLAPLAILLLLASAPRFAHAQTSNVGIGTTAPDVSAALDIVSSSKGVLLPRVASTSSVATPAPGLLVYQTGSPAGFYYNAGTAAQPNWQRLTSGLAYDTATGLAVGPPNAPVTANPTGASNKNYYPFAQGRHSDFKVQYLVTAAQLRAAGLQAGYLSEVALSIMEKNTSAPYLNWTVRLGSTTATSLTGFSTVPLTTVYSAPPAGYYSVLGINAWTFAQPYLWDGTSSLVVQFCYNNASVNYIPNGTDGDYIYMNYTSTQCRAHANGSSPGDDGCAFATGTTDIAQPAIRFRGAGYVLPATAGSVGQVLTQQAGGVVGFEDPEWTQSGTSLYPQALSSNVGIGTSSPGQKLEVAGQVYSSTGGFRFPDNTVQTTAATTATGASFIQNQSSPTQAGANFNISGGGLVGGMLGVGTTNPQAGLHVDQPESSSSAALGVLLSGGSSGNPSIELRGSGKTPYLDLAENPGLDYSSRLMSQSGTLNLYSVGSTTLKVNGTSYLTGNVGIGTAASATLKLDVNGNANVSGNSTVGGSSSVGSSYVAGNSTVTGNSTVAGNSYVNGSSIVDANLGVGTSSPAARLDVDGGILARSAGRISNQGAHLQWNRSNGTGETWLINQNGGGPGGIYFGQSNNVTSGSNTITEWARFDSNGNLGIGAPSAGPRLFVSGAICATGGLNCTSDGRYKRDVVPVQGPWPAC